MSKRLLIVTQHFWPENFRINDLVDGFLADDIVVDILCGMPNYPHGEWFDGYTASSPMLEDYHGANLYRCREIRRKGNTSLRIFLNYISFPLTAACSLRKLPGDYDAVLCYNTSPVLMSFPAILAARSFKAPLTNYVLDIWPENLYSVLNIQNKALRRIASAVSDWHYRRADRLITVSESLSQRLRARVGNTNAKGCQEPEKRYAVIPQYCEDFYDCKAVPRNECAATVSDTVPTTKNATETQYQDNAQSAAIADMPEDTVRPFLIQFAGNFSPAQSLNTVLDAIAMVKAAQGTNAPAIHLQLIGDGMSLAALQTQAKQLHLDDCVQFYGSVTAVEIPALAAKADALLISLSDSADVGLTIPAKFASCMAAGKPLLVSINGEGARVASESKGALVSAASDTKALAENMLALAAMPLAARTAMGEASHAYYKTHFNRSTLLQAIETFIF
ncbi:MAG: glycosyltransferase family 4 protein [Faecalibacterium sp.]